MVDRVENGAGGGGGNGVSDETDNDEAKTPAAAAEASPSSRGGKEPEGFTKAYERAEAKLTGKDKPADKPAEKKPEPKPAEKKAEKPAPKPADKPAPKADEKPAKADEKPAKADKPAPKADKEADDNDEDDAGDDAGAEDKPKGPLKPRRGWPRRMQEDFQYLSPEEQEARLSAPLVAPANWDEESKASFAKLPVEAQDELIFRSKEIERGYQGKFEALAAERKTFDEIKAAVPERVRAVMNARGINEAQAFKTLAGLQEQAMIDPLGYVVNFIRQGKLDVEQLADRLLADDSGGGRQEQRGGQPPVELHPAFQALKQERDRLHAQIEGQQRQAREQGEQQAKFVLDEVLTSRDEASGELRYPWARVLSNWMADLYESDAESFKGLSPQDAFDLAYRTAYDAHPECARADKAAKAKPAPSDGDQAGKTADEKRAERARDASTPKSKAPKSAPASKGGEARFTKAFERAKQRLSR